MLNNFIYAKAESLFEESLSNNEVPEDAIGFIEDTKLIWNHGTYFGGSSIPTKITYSKLKTLRDNGELSEGHLYRITDYVTTTVLSETKSAGNVFDVIVLATSTNELSHNARAIQHEGDTYFDGNDLGAWELWYDLDNDTNKYNWADATNGKGVIYRMIDEKRNDCPYDFKNILFYNDNFTDYTTTDKYYFTFSYVVSGVLYDGTVEKQVTSCYGNEMGVCKFGKKFLNKNVFRNKYFSNYCHSNTFGYDCYANTFGYSCQSNTLGNYCQNNTFEDSCYANTFSSYLIAHKIDYGHTFITVNDEYYEDGSGKLVPVKHPDLSTQPSILPYKFMGQYVYEQLIVTYIGSTSSSMSIDIRWPPSLDKDKIYLDLKVILTYKNGVSIAVPIMIYNDDKIQINGTNIYDIDRDSPVYLHVVYTSMPEENSYYGHNNY